MKEKMFDNGEESFAELFEKSMMGRDDFEPGQAFETEIVSISENCIFLQLSGKSEGILEREEMTDKEGNLMVAEGDTVKVFFLKAADGELHFTTRISGREAGQAVLENAFKQGIPVEGVVEKEIKGGFSVKIGESRAFCPYSQMGEKRVDDPKVYIGRHLSFKIMENSERGRNIIVSNRAIIEDEKSAAREKLAEILQEGMKVRGQVKSIQKFGAFVEIQGVQALLPVSEISRKRVEDINSVLSVGQEIEAEILKLDWQNDKISISMKALEADPWDKARKKYKVGSRHEGKVARITNFGAFVTLEPGLDGLIHISDMVTDTRDAAPGDILKQGQEVLVKINSVDVVKKRISLKHVSDTQQEDAMQKYMDDDEDGDTYNPFAALLKDRK